MLCGDRGLRNGPITSTGPHQWERDVSLDRFGGNDEPYIRKVGQVTWTSDNHQTLSIQITGSRWDTYLARGRRSPERSQEGFDENRTTSRDDNIGCYQYGSRHHIRKAMVDATQPKNRLENEPSQYDELQVQRH